MSSSVLVKFFNGPNMGAEAELEPGEWRLGSDFQCELVLADAGAHPVHAVLVVTQEGVHCLPKEGAVTLGGELVPEEGAPVPFFAPLRLGGSHLCIGPTDRVWTEDELESLTKLFSRSQPAQNVESPLNAASTNASAGNNDSDTKTKPRTDVTSPISLSGPHHHNQQFSVLSSALQPQKKQRSWVFWLRVLCVCVLLGGLILTLTRQFSEDSMTALQRLLQEPEYARVQLNLEGPAPSLHGAVTYDAELVRLEAFAAGLGEPVDIRVFTVEDVRQSVENHLRKSGFPLTVRIGPDKRLRVYGYAKNADLLQQALAPVQEALNAVGMESAVMHEATLAAALQKPLQAAGLLEKVRFSAGDWNMVVLLSGVSPQEREQVRAIVMENADALRTRVALSFMDAGTTAPPVSGTAVPVAPATQQKVPARICDKLAGVVSGKELQVQFEGRLYGRGNRLPSGWRISEINTEQIVLMDGRTMRVCPFDTSTPNN